jgi:hypothetical protein
MRKLFLGILAVLSVLSLGGCRKEEKTATTLPAQKQIPAEQLRPGVESHLLDDCRRVTPIVCSPSPAQYILDQGFPPTKEADEFGPELYQYVVTYDCEGHVTSVHTYSTAHSVP